MSNNSAVTEFDAILSLNNSSFSTYLLCSCLLILKMMGVTLLTIFYRVRNKAFISPEDAVWFKGETVTNENVERIRRAHQNDLENITIFLITSFAFLWNQSSIWWTQFLFSLFTITRVLHTIVYTLIIVPQPTRAVLWLIGFLITGYMAIHTAINAFIYLL